jgi:ParB-like chromosome segregation protein Spo0J
MARKRPATSSASAPAVVWRGEEALRPLLVPVGELRLLPANPNRHPDGSIEAIAGSLERFGQQKAVVVGRDGTVAAGNGTLEAACRLGWTHLAAVRSSLSPLELLAYGVADNETARWSERDEAITARLIRSLETADVPLAGLGLSDDQIRAMLGGVDPDPGDDPDGDGGDPPPRPEPSAGVGRPIELTAEERADVDAAVRWAREYHEDPTLTEGFCLAWICRRVMGE